MTRFAILSVLLFAASAFAQPTEAPPPSPGEPKTKVMVFDPESVLGDANDPGTETVTVPLRQPGPSLIRVRTDFQHELLQSAELL